MINNRDERGIGGEPQKREMATISDKSKDRLNQGLNFQKGR